MLNLGSLRARLVAVLLASFIATTAPATVQSVCTGISGLGAVASYPHTRQ